MVLGLRDYVTKNRFPGIVLGLSGGIDFGAECGRSPPTRSAPTRCIAS